MLISTECFDIPQLLKQATEYKLQVKVMREQEIDMKTQVQSQGIVGNIDSFFCLSGGSRNVSPHRFSSARHVLQEV